MDNNYFSNDNENPYCNINNTISKTGFAYFSSSKFLKTEKRTKNIIFNDIPVMTDIFDYNNNYIEVKKTGWYYIQFIINIPKNETISSLLSININNSIIEGGILNIETDNKLELCSSKCFSAQTIYKIKENSKISINCSENISIIAPKIFQNTSSLFILKIL